MAPFCTFSEGKINLIRDKQAPPILYRTVIQSFTNKKVISNQLISYITGSDSSVFSYLFIPSPFLAFELTFLAFSIPKLY